MVHRSSWVRGETQGDMAKCYSRVVLDLLYPITPTIGAHQRRLPATIPPDHPTFPGAAWPTTPRLRVFRPGGAQRREDVAQPPSWRSTTTKTDTRAYRPEEWHAADRRVVRRPDIVLTKGAGLRAPTTTRHPVDRVQGTSYGGQTRVGICRQPRGVIVGSRVENACVSQEL